MDNENNNLSKHAMTYGAIIGLGIVVYIILLYVTDLLFNSWLGIVQFVILFIGLLLSARSYRDKSKGGFLTYGQALGFSVMVTIFLSVIVGFFNFILYRYIDPSLADKSIALLEEKFQNSRFITPESLEKSRHMMTSIWSVPLNILSFSLWGSFFSLITSAFVAKNRNPFDEGVSR
jgi:hypothetical protein